METATSFEFYHRFIRTTGTAPTQDPTKLARRKTKIKEFKGSTCETDIKNGFFIPTDGSATKRAEIIKKFKDHKLAILPDGRKIEDVVRK